MSTAAIASSVSRAWDILSVRLTAQGYPETVRLALPAQFSEPASASRLALISARTSALIEHLEVKWGERLVDPAELKKITETIRDRRPLRTPVLGLSKYSTDVSAFSFVSGHHRITVLHLLGARRVPVAVPWHCAEDFLDQLG